GVADQAAVPGRVRRVVAEREPDEHLHPRIRGGDRKGLPDVGRLLPDGDAAGTGRSRLQPVLADPDRDVGAVEPEVELLLERVQRRAVAYRVAVALSRPVH